jgi:hypothetical protein
MHPFEIVKDILVASGVDASVYDAATMDHTASEYYHVAHWCLSKFDLDADGGISASTGVGEGGVGAKGLIDDIAGLVWASLSPDEDGIFRLKLYNENASPIRHLTSDDVQDLVQESAASPLYNKISINAVKFTRKHYLGVQAPTRWYAIGPEESRDITVGFTEIDETSKAKFNYLGLDSGENDFTVETDWLIGPSLFYGPLRNGIKDVYAGPSTNRSPGLASWGGNFLFQDHTGFHVYASAYYGFCGTKYTVTPATGVAAGTKHNLTFTINGATAVNGASRTAYLLIEGPAYTLHNDVYGNPQITATDYASEIVKINNISTNLQSYMLSDDEADDLGLPHLTTTLVQYRKNFAPSTSVGNSRFEEVLGPFRYDATSGGSIPYWVSRDIAGTGAGLIPTGDVPSPAWTSADAIKLNYPATLRYTIEGVGGANGTSGIAASLGNFPAHLLGSASSGRGVKGSSTAVAWYMRSNVIFEDQGDPSDPEDPDGHTIPTDGDDQAWFPRVWDITIPIYAAERRVNRFSLGMPTFSCRVSLAHADLQIGDFITVSDDIPLYTSRDGISSSVILEIVGKDVDALADTPGVSLRLAWVRDDGIAYSRTASYATTTPSVASSVTNALVLDAGGTILTTSQGDPVQMRIRREGGN